MASPAVHSAMGHPDSLKRSIFRLWRTLARVSLIPLLAFVGPPASADTACWQRVPPPVEAGDRAQVIRSALEFLEREEQVPAHPYWPGGRSGITIGVGWDLGQHSSQALEETWKGLTTVDIGRLRTAAGQQGPAASKLLPSLHDVTIPHDLAMQILESSIRDDFYPLALKAFPGADQLPANVQVALISVVFNRGGGLGHDPDWSVARTVDARWEMREFRKDVRDRDFFAIYAHLDTMKRLWEDSGPRGLPIRRRHEGTLVRPYVDAQLRWDAELERLRAAGASPCS
jgi:hypothetical protein